MEVVGDGRERNKEDVKKEGPVTGIMVLRETGNFRSRPTDRRARTTMKDARPCGSRAHSRSLEY